MKNIYVYESNFTYEFPSFFYQNFWQYQHLLWFGGLQNIHQSIALDRSVQIVFDELDNLELRIITVNNEFQVGISTFKEMLYIILIGIPRQATKTNKKIISVV
jgi:hypothetical protein